MPSSEAGPALAVAPETGRPPAGEPCGSCKTGLLGRRRVDMAFWSCGRLVLVRDIPSLVCGACGEQYTEDEVAMRLDMMRGADFRHAQLWECNRYRSTVFPGAAMTGRNTAGAVLLMLLIAAATLLRAQEQGYAFMPPGGRTLMERILETSDTDVATIVGRKADRAAWTAWAQEAGLDDAEAETLGAYAALNFPLLDSAGAALAEGKPVALPPDGKDLAIAQCQFCHSFFTGYLMQYRDENSWLGTFKAPFHAEIPMDPTERATFAAYSALNIPLKFEDVPPELRF